MTAPPQQRAHIADRVQRLEAWAFTVDAGMADIKAAEEQLPAMIREEVLAYTEPVFGEIMAGRATLATKEDLNDLERRLTELMEKRFESVDARFESVDAKLQSVDSKLQSVDAKLQSVDARFESVDATLQSLDTKLDQVLAALGKTDG
ncbi:hypothetical protein ETD86_28510 [Nonomuraea turkmeniaca]|uniref:Uncharacterized protein n=1 Tax=Nonomuraea turkmeniaca TaxID=103838 RepID=A0A5S4FB68_9ACTN|nr:hypothetical protein [Nonomuraea turkmeniaca]TMR14648.1 hypothetical protein ETD86_28510 [Nonomuraea turkmeniaca]